MPEHMLIEHSEPGYVISLSDDLENTLRNLSWEQVEKLRQDLTDLACQISPECGRSLEVFHIETPGEVGASLPSLATLEDVDEDQVRKVLQQAGKQFNRQFKLYTSCLLEGKKYSRQDYITDIKQELMHGSYGHLRLPAELKEHRRNLLQKSLPHFFETPGIDDCLVGHRWVEEQADRMKKILEEVDNDIQAVGHYLLNKISTAEKEEKELFYWCVFAAQVGDDQFYRLYADLEQKASYLHQRVYYCYQLYQQGWCFRKKLVDNMGQYVNEAQNIYIPEAVQALEAILAEMTENPWSKLWDKSPKKQGNDTGDEEEQEEL